MNPRSQAGFTLIELLVVISIVAVLAGMLLPAIGQVKTSAKTLTCLNNLRQVGMAMGQYCEDNDGLLPYTDFNPSVLYPSKIATWEVWMGQIFPWLELGPESSTGWDSRIIRDIGTGRSIARGCPEWKNDVLHIDEFRHGYGMSYCPAFPVLPGTTSRGNLVWRCEMPLSRITVKSKHILLGESTGALMSVDYSGAPAIAFTAGDPIRHGGRQSNYVFADFHAKTIPVTAKPWLGLKDPAGTAWDP